MHKASAHTAANCSVLDCSSCVDIRTTIVIYAIAYEKIESKEYGETFHDKRCFFSAVNYVIFIFNGTEQRKTKNNGW